MQRSFRASLAVQLAVSVFVILLIGTVTQGIITTRSLLNGIAESDQRRAFDLLLSLEKDLDYHLNQSTLDTNSIFGVFRKFAANNTSLSPLLLNETGEILVSEVDSSLYQKKTIDVSSLKLFDGISFPIYIPNPRNLTEFVLFASKEIKTKRFSGYILVILDEQQSHASSLVSATKRSLVTQIGIILIFSVLLGFTLTSLFTKRLKTLTQAVTRYAPENEVSIPNIAGDDEISDLAKSFTRMTTDIKSAFERLKERDALRRELIAGVSHDFRTPLSSIQGYVQQLKRLLARGEATPEVRDDFLNTIEKNALALTALMESLSELSKLDFSIANLKRESLSVKQLLEDIIKRFKPKFDEKKIKYSLISDSDIELLADKLLLERAISNIVDNAIRHTSDTVMVDIKIISSLVVISVSDNGSGIVETDLPHIFETFYRGDKARDKDKGGSGLGLAIAKSIIEAHGGSIEAKNLEDSGACFMVMLRA